MAQAHQQRPGRVYDIAGLDRKATRECCPSCGTCPAHQHCCDKPEQADCTTCATCTTCVITCLGDRATRVAAALDDELRDALLAVGRGAAIRCESHSHKPLTQGRDITVDRDGITRRATRKLAKLQRLHLAGWTLPPTGAGQPVPREVRWELTRLGRMVHTKLRKEP